MLFRKFKKLTLPELKQHILDLTPEVINFDACMYLLAFIPNQQEIKQCSEF